MGMRPFQQLPFSEVPERPAVPIAGVPPVVGDRLRALVPAAPFVRLAEASHFAQVDAATRFAAAIEPFLSGG